MKRQGVKAIEKGDIVLFHTGWVKLLGKDDARYNRAEPGLGKEGALYLVDKGVAAVGADTWGLEVLPFEKGVGVFEVHQILLNHNGIYILETMDTTEMVKDGVSEAFFTLGASRLTGAVQAIINPVAIKYDLRGRQAPQGVRLPRRVSRKSRALPGFLVALRCA
jgi:kynurenine formamidase